MNKQSTLSLFDDEQEMRIAADETVALRMEDLNIDEMVGINPDALHTSADLKAIIEDDDFEFETHITEDSSLTKQTVEDLMDEVTMLINEVDTSGDLNVEIMTDPLEEELISFVDEPSVVIETEPIIHITEPISIYSLDEETADLNINPDVSKNVTIEEFNDIVGDINMVSNDFVKEISVKEEEVIEEERAIGFGKVNIMVIGAGDSGCTTINTLYGLNNKEITTVSMHVSSQMLSSRYADKKILIGESIFNGNGSNGDYEAMTQAFEDDSKKIRQTLKGVDMLFLTGDFGTDVGSIGLLEVAKIAREQGILTIGFPKILKRSTDFDTGLLIDTYLPQFKEVVDSSVVIDDNVLYPKVAKLGLLEAIMYSDNMLINGIRGIYELITRAGKINLDYADIKTAFANRGDAILGCGSASGDHLVVKAIEDAFKSDVLDLASVKNAQTIIFNISCASKTVTIDNATEATNYIYSLASSGNVQQLFFGYTIDESLGDEVKVTFVAAGTTPTNKVPGAPIEQPTKVMDTFTTNEDNTNEHENSTETNKEIKSKPKFFDF